MRFFLFALLVLILAPFVTAAQRTPHYYADGSGDLSGGYLGGHADVIYYTSLGPDSMMIAKDSANNTYTSYYKLDTGRHFFRRVKSWESSGYNFVVVYKRSILVMCTDSSFIYYMQDKNKAHDFPANEPRLRIRKDSLVAVADSMFAKEYSEKVKASAGDRQKILNAFAQHWTSKRTDPALVRDVVKWSGNATTTVYIGSSSYYYMRNNLGTVLYKCIPVVYKYHIKNKCYLQYRMLGYDALNGGNFSADLKDYATSNLCTAWGAGSSFNMYPNSPYEIDCQ
jgi:hypothetical protein